MRQKLIFLVMLLCSAYVSAYAIVEEGPERTLTKDDALEIAQKVFRGKDVDYFILDDDTLQNWAIFVDAEPMKGWEHECYLLGFPKKTTFVYNENVVVSRVRLSIPPTGNFVPLLVKNRYGLKANLKPIVEKSEQANNPGTAAQRTYAVIISGGVNKYYNYERYWNDCSFIYQTLVNKYGIPKDNIYPIMSDGTNPAEDQRLNVGGFASQKLDLDNDGINDIKLAATKENIRNTLSSLANKMNKDDHLFIYVIDHGGTTDNNTSSYICLWENESLYDYELSSMVEPFCNKLVNVNVVLGQCFAGGFNDNLTKIGCVVASACTGSESSWSCYDIPFDEFVYQWTCAVNGADYYDNPLAEIADSDGNNHVTMEEAFAYAQSHDRISAETPQYVSTPLSVGEDLAFDNLAPSVDLYIKDNPEDTGKVPNNTTEEFWKSPSIWVRNQDDGIEEEENPYYTPEHIAAVIYVKVENRGKEAYTGGKWLHVYWSQASTVISPAGWKGLETYNNYVTGEHLRAVHIGNIEPNESRTLSVSWSLPIDCMKHDDGWHHFCLLTKITDSPFDEPYVPGVTHFDPRVYKDQAQKNVSIIIPGEFDEPTLVYVRNPEGYSKNYTLELKPQKSADNIIFAKANVEMEMNPLVFNAWERGGFKSQNIVRIADSNNAVSRKVKFLSSSSRLENIQLQPNEFDKVKLKFTFKNSITKDVTLDLIQRDENGKIVGGETFILKSKFISYPVNIVQSPAEDGTVNLSVDNTDYKSILWMDGDDNEISVADEITVAPNMNNNLYKVAVTDNEGGVAFGSVSLEAGYGISSVSAMTPGRIIVGLHNEAPEGSTIKVVSVLDSTSKIENAITAGCKEIAIDSECLQKGVYAVLYYVNGEIIDQQKVSIQ